MTDEPNTPDPIVEEVRAAREAYAAKFNFDLDAIITDLQQRAVARRRSEEAGEPTLPAVVQRAG